MLNRVPFGKFKRVNDLKKYPCPDLDVALPFCGGDLLSNPVFCNLGRW